MKVQKAILFIVMLLLVSLTAQTKTEKIINNSQSRFVTYSKETSLCDFIDYVDFLYQKYENKAITINTDCRIPIGVTLTDIPYNKALLQICDFNNLDIRNSKNEIVIAKKKAKKESNDSITKLLISKQVKISAIMFEANLDKMNERGVDLNFALSKSGMRINGGVSSPQKNNNANLAIRVASDFYKFSGYTSAMFKFFESHNLGKIISKMTVTVRDGETGRMQVGSDISVKQLDFAGNVTDAFFSTGTIIKVIPKVFSNDSSDFALLKIHVERSIPRPDELSTEIKRTLTDTEVILRDKQETIIGSLLLEENITIREGIPVLKDLPWWVLGIRYLTGYNSELTQHKEVVMLIKAKVIPTVENIDSDGEKAIKDSLQFRSKELLELNNSK